ncbi:MAG: beta-mannosidase [Kiritimatiellia bacterium]
MKEVDLSGSWTLRRVGQKKTTPARIPGCVHTDLLAAGEIEDPFSRDNESRVQWIGEADWLYERTFDVEDLTAVPQVLLRCEGLDTLATVFINDAVVGQANNMYRTWEFDVRDALCPGRNKIAIRFDSAVRHVAEKNAVRRLPGWAPAHEPASRAWLRKEPCNFGWDWGPVLVTAGIWRAIGLVAFDTARLADVAITQKHAGAGEISIDVAVSAEALDAATPLEALVKVSYKGGVVASARAKLAGGTARVSLPIKNPQRWWPNGMGEQPLYEVSADLCRGREVLDHTTRRIGLRTLRLDRQADEWGESFQFVVNDVPFFAKGANWIPGDAFITRMTRVEYARLIKAAAVANMNMLRCWGGGIYENDAFYDLCDEYGICVWQDFMFSCSTYPTFDAAWMDNVRVEAEQNIRRLRNHPSLALWCGNNELEQGLVGDTWDDNHMSWSDYAKLFDELLPEAVKRLDAQRDYWPCSPHTPRPGDRKNFNDPNRGDGHLWDVWHGRQPFEWYRTANHRFCSEFGFQSFPEPRMAATYTAPEDRNITSYVMEKHQRSGIGNTVIMQYMLEWYRMPVGFDNTLWLSQIQQGMAIKYAVEHWRRNRPRCMGALYWQLNDCWPVASWSSVDYAGRWKALHFMARRFYAPVLVSGVENSAAGTVEIHLASDNRRAFKGAIQWRVTRVDGSPLQEGSQKVMLEASCSAVQTTLNLSELLQKHGPRDLLVWLTAQDEQGAQVSANLVTFCRPKHLELLPPRIRVDIRPWDDNSYAVTLTARHPALWTWMALEGQEAKYDDNFVCLDSERPVRIRVIPATRMKPDAFRQALRVSSIFDTYQEHAPANSVAAAAPVPAAAPAVSSAAARVLAVRRLATKKRG